MGLPLHVVLVEISSGTGACSHPAEACPPFIHMRRSAKIAFASLSQLNRCYSDVTVLLQTFSLLTEC